jgi:hypothetical protein
VFESNYLGLKYAAVPECCCVFNQVIDVHAPIALCINASRFPNLGRHIFVRIDTVGIECHDVQILLRLARFLSVSTAKRRCEVLSSSFVPLDRAILSCEEANAHAI